MIQLPLEIPLRDDAAFDNFYAKAQPEVYQALQTMSTLKGEPFIYLHGLADSGKTHLVQAVCQQAARNGFSAIYVPLKDRIYGVQSLENMEQLDLIGIDDIDAIQKQSGWEEALFHLFNKCRSNKTYLLMTAKYVPQGLELNLADLKSRLSSGLCYSLSVLTDAEKKEALILHATKRGLKLDQPVADFLLHHCPRTLSALFKQLELLDKASLQAQRRLTIPFVKQVLEL